MKSFIEYIRAVRGELTHVSWPSRGQAIAFTALVIGISVVIALILGAFDYIFSLGLKEILNFIEN